MVAIRSGHAEVRTVAFATETRPSQVERLSRSKYTPGNVFDVYSSSSAQQFQPHGDGNCPVSWNSRFHPNLRRTKMSLGIVVCASHWFRAKLSHRQSETQASMAPARRAKACSTCGSSCQFDTKVSMALVRCAEACCQGRFDYCAALHFEDQASMASLTCAKNCTSYGSSRRPCYASSRHFQTRSAMAI